MIDHIMLRVRDVAKSRAFYLAALAPLGYGVAMAFVLDPDGHNVEAVTHRPE